MTNAPPESTGSTAAAISDAFRLLFDLSVDPIMLLDPARMVFLEANQACVDLFLFANQAEVRHLSPARLSAPLQFDGQPALAAIEEMVGLAIQNGSHRFGWQCQRLNGECFPTEVVVTLLQAGDAPLLTVTVRDLTAQRASEEALRSERARLKATLEVAIDCIVTIDTKGLVLDWNPAAERTFGWSREEAMGREMAELIIPHELRSRHRQGLQRAVGNSDNRIIGQRVELSALHRDGHTFPVELAINRVETGGVPIFTGFIRDITKRRSAEAEILALNADLERRVEEAVSELRLQTVQLRESTQALERFKAVTDATSDMVCITTLDAKMIYMNPSGKEIIGFGDEDITGMSYHEFATPEFIAQSEHGGFQTAMEHGFWEADVTMKHRSGRVVPLSFVGIGIRSADGTPIHFGGIARDITARLEMEQQLRDSLDQERSINQMKTNFVNLVSHEFRTPLGVIMSSTEILSKYFERLPVELRQEHLNDVLEATRRMGALMEEVLLLARADAGRLDCKPELLELADFCHVLAEDVSAGTAQKCPIELTVESSEASAKGDPALLRHIFTNLLSNAVKYSPAGVPVRFTATRIGNEAVLEVIDSGMGIPEADMQLLFTAFHRGNNVSETAGTGLGLVIVKRCVELHGGTIEVRSVVGKGSTFSVRLPLFTEA